MSLVLESVSRRVDGVPGIIDATLVLERGAPNVLLGPTLSGKTSLMRMMAGLDRPDTGRIVLDGRDVTGLPARRRSVAMVYQQFINYPTLTVAENIASPLRVAGVARAEVERRVREAAALLRLDGLLERLPPQLSGGQQQRTAIARALVRRADVVLLDEPLANLDYKLREELREELPRLFADSGAILVYATTEPTEALLLGGRTITLWQGRVTQSGTGAEVYRHPRSLAAARVFSDPPLNEWPDADGGVRAFRAEHLQLGAAPAGALTFDGVVEVTEITGSESFVHVTVEGRRWVALAPGVVAFEPGEAVALWVSPTRLFAFDGDGAVRDAA